MADAKLDELIVNLNNRVEALESRNVFQDDVIEQLSTELAVHQNQLTEIKAQMQLMANRLKEAGSSAEGKVEVDMRPPHY
jgi:SlyX protein